MTPQPTTPSTTDTKISILSANLCSILAPWGRQRQPHCSRATQYYKLHAKGTVSVEIVHKCRLTAYLSLWSKYLHQNLTAFQTGCTNPVLQAAGEANFFKVEHIGGFSVRNLLHVSFLMPRSLRRILELWIIRAPISSGNKMCRTENQLSFSCCRITALVQSQINPACNTSP
jgi:hypothetical protein